VATIQIRDIPDDVHQELQQRAREAGQSLQAYMREQVIEASRSRSRRAAALQRLEIMLEQEGPVGLTAEQIVEAVHADRR